MQLLFVHFSEYLLIFLDDNMDKEREQFSHNENFHFYLIFCQFQSGVAYKSFTFKNNCVF